MAVARKKPRYALRVIRGGYAPADASTAAQLRDKGHRVGDLLFAELVKPRSPGFHRLAHQLGGMLAENLDAFTGMEAHAVLKRLQIEADVGCDHIALIFPNIGPCEYRQARSLSYESMGEDEFKPLIAGLCRHVAAKYWPTCTADQVESMASCWVEAA
jgi:hypothetical protein